MYAGINADEQNLFDRFTSFIKQKDIGESIVLEPGQYLYMNNNLTLHKRESMAHVDFKTPLEDNNLVYIRRLVRQYLQEAPKRDLQRIIRTTPAGVQGTALSIFGR
jgi:hypothetical protein